MKYYETTYVEYLQSNTANDLHPELDSIHGQMPSKIENFHNLILYGPSGAGKYTQALKIIEKYSPSKLHYDKKISVSNEKTEKKKQIVVDANPKKKGSQPKKEIHVSKSQDFTYRISDIHYEVDMSLLGCNSKNLWHDIFFQIVDIISVKPQKVGIIVCKNFDSIYNELLDIFYSYMKHPLEHLNTHIYFILLTECVSFIPNNILNSSVTIPVKRPSKTQYISMIKDQKRPFFFQTSENSNSSEKLMSEIDEHTILNSKELYVFNRIKTTEDLPCDIDYTICDKILYFMYNPDKVKLSEFRNLIYDLLVYNVNIPECIYYIITESIRTENLSKDTTSDILKYSYTFLKYYNNNYRSIYHLESMIFFIMNKMHFKESH